MKAKNSDGVYLRGKVWWVDFIAPDGRRIRRRVPASTKNEAMKIRSVLIADAERGELRLPSHKKTVLFHDLCDKYIEYAKLNLKNKGWITVRAQLKPVTPAPHSAAAYFGNVPIGRITPTQCSDYRDEVKRILEQRAWTAAAAGKLVRGETPTFKPATANHYLQTLKRLFAWAEDKGMIDRNPASKVKRYKPKEQPFHLVTPEEERRLLEAAEYRPEMRPNMRRPKYLKSALVLALHTGARRREVTQLKWSQVNLEQQIVTFTETKNNKLRHCPLDDTALYLLTEMRSQTGDCVYVFDNGKGKASDFVGAWETVRKKAGVPGGLVFHSVRHTTASRLAMGGVDLATVGEILGNPSSVKRYVHLTPDHLKAAIKVLDRKPVCHNPATTDLKMVVENAVSH